MQRLKCSGATSHKIDVLYENVIEPKEYKIYWKCMKRPSKKFYSIETAMNLSTAKKKSHKKVMKKYPFAQYTHHVIIDESNMEMMESFLIPEATPQDPSVIQELKQYPKYYHTTNLDLSGTLSTGAFITHAIGYAKSLGKKNIYEVQLPSNFAHTKMVGNRWAKYHIISKSDTKIIKQVK